ncbi:alpha/beta hydrolase family protein [Kangiella taiwanensis]|uniref:S9 family peptidase n=1 Tax=Kangiella taiwanensis TaxID=1079179 RepID=A0ABP8I656_9GAMM|nr:S9 family peptidase [Kangiella taiwanensis]
MKYLSILLGLSVASISVAAEPRSFTAEDMVTFNRVGAATLSPDGETVAYQLRTTDLEADRGRYDIYTVSSTGGDAQQITKHAAADTSPTWSADGKKLYFLSSRTGSSQLHSYDFKSQSIEQVSDFPVGVDTFKLSSDNSHIVFSATVFPECERLICSKENFDKRAKQKATGKLYNKTFVRHWDQWLDGTQSRLFSAELTQNVSTATRLSHALNGNVPSRPFGGAEEYTISPDGKTVVFTLRVADEKESRSTNFDLYQVPINGGDITNITQANKAWDTQPVFSPDGSKLAWLAMDRPDFEADRLQIHLKDLKTGEVTNLTKDWDRSVSSYAFSQDGKTLYVTGNNIGKKSLWAFDIASKTSKLLTHKGYVGGVSVGEEQLIYQYDDLKKPADLYRFDLSSGESQQITQVNQSVLKDIAFGDYEQFSFEGWNDETVYGYAVKPADFDPEKEYPLAFLIHGGPQGSFGDHFHYRWNPQTYTGQGFVAVMIDFHGSTGYGQEFTDSITGDWGGKPLVDLQKGMAYIDETYDFIDTDNSCALGASYGGYMINWIAGQWPDQFKCLVNHDGIFDNRMMYYATEELWFVEWENGGTYYDTPETFEKHNPVHHVKNWKTPMLVVQGTKDFRVPETQSLGTFTALQRQGIPSQFLVFENENHWVLKPNNSIQWHNVVNNWLHKWLSDK